MDMNQLQTEITNTELTKNELQRQLDILTKEYEMETKELERLNCKNLEYKTHTLNKRILRELRIKQKNKSKGNKT